MRDDQLNRLNALLKQRKMNHLEIAYYPIFECGKTGKQYDEPRALIESKNKFNGIEGTDFREVPLRYLTKITC